MNIGMSTTSVRMIRFLETGGLASKSVSHNPFSDSFLTTVDTYHRKLTVDHTFGAPE